MLASRGFGNGRPEYESGSPFLAGHICQSSDPFRVVQLHLESASEAAKVFLHNYQESVSRPSERASTSSMVWRIASTCENVTFYPLWIGASGEVDLQHSPRKTTRVHAESGAQSNCRNRVFRETGRVHGYIENRYNE